MRYVNEPIIEPWISRGNGQRWVSLMKVSHPWATKTQPENYSCWSFSCKIQPGEKVKGRILVPPLNRGCVSLIWPQRKINNSIINCIWLNSNNHLSILRSPAHFLCSDLQATLAICKECLSGVLFVPPPEAADQATTKINGTPASKRMRRWMVPSRRHRGLI